MFHRLLLTLFLFVSATAAAPVTLHNETISLSLDPATLSLSTDAQALSSPQPDLGPVTNLTNTDRSVSWTYSQSQITTTATLHDDTLTVHFSTPTPGTVTFPVIPSPPTAFVLPLAEGAYIPSDDADWSAHLAAASPMDTTADLSMPFLATRSPTHTVTYLLTNPFGNSITFHDNAGRPSASLTHTFRANWKVKEYEVRISLGPPSPIEPALRYRRYLIDTNQFTPLADKITHTPDAAKLLGAPHVYLWGADLLTPSDVKDFKSLAAELLSNAAAKQLLSPETQKLLTPLPTAPYVDNYTKSQITHDLSTLIASSQLDPASLPSLNPRDTWGDGVSPKMIHEFKAAGLDRLRIAVSDAADLRHNPAAVTAAVDAGYLIGPYDSYHSIHPKNRKDTWETAQFPDPALYDSGAIVKQDGTPMKGFQQKGHLLSPLISLPAVQQRVTTWLKDFPGANLWFIDCDAFGQLYDDFSPNHPATQLDDMTARLARLAWIRDANHAVIGSEGGSSYAASTLHFAEGVETPGIGWGDPDLGKDKSSPYYLGGYFPPGAPAVFFKSVPLKPSYYKFNFDPRYRLPLYQAALHDSIVTTHHWSFSSFKLTDQLQTRELTEFLYAVPPLYHLNPAEFAKRKPAILAHYTVFSPLHRATALLPLTDFAYLTPDRLVQRTTFGQATQVLANFSDNPYTHADHTIPPRAVLILRPGVPPQNYHPEP